MGCALNYKLEGHRNIPKLQTFVLIKKYSQKIEDFWGMPEISCDQWQHHMGTGRMGDLSVPLLAKINFLIHPNMMTKY